MNGYRAERIADGLYWGETYFVVGDLPSKSRVAQGTKAPPWAGWGSVVVVDKNPNAKVLTLFCHNHLESFQVPRSCYEVEGLRPTRKPADPERIVAQLMAAWELAAKYGWQRDYDTAALILQMLGKPVPVRVLPEGEVEKPRGGAEADDILGLIKPVKRNGRRGQVLAFFLPGARSIREAMAEFSVSRSNLLSQLYLLNKEHGIGYVLVGDAAQITLPAGCEDPFEPEAKAA